MAIAFTIGAQTFAALTTATARCALWEKIGAPHYQVHRFHPPGTNGNYIVRSGRDGMSMHFRVRYHGTYSTIHTNYQTDREAWANDGITIVDGNGVTWLECNLVSMMPVNPAKGHGRVNAEGYMDVDVVFTWDN